MTYSICFPKFMNSQTLKEHSLLLIPFDYYFNFGVRYMKYYMIFQAFGFCIFFTLLDIPLSNMKGNRNPMIQPIIFLPHRTRAERRSKEGKLPCPRFQFASLLNKNDSETKGERCASLTLTCKRPICPCKDQDISLNQILSPMLCVIFFSILVHFELLL